MNARTAISLLLLGTAILIAGSVFKNQHWPSANIQIVLGGMLQFVALVVLSFRVARSTGFKDLLNG